MKKFIIILTLLASMQRAQCMEKSTYLHRARKMGTHSFYVNGEDTCTDCMWLAPNPEADEFYSNYIVHMNWDHSEPGMFTCTHCDIAFKSLTHAAEHSTTCPHSNNEIHCTFCGFNSSVRRVSAHLCPKFRSKDSMNEILPFIDEKSAAVSTYEILPFMEEFLDSNTNN